MKANGTVRRIDDLGRVVIPKDVRRACGIKEGDPLEIFYDEKEQSITFKLYETDEMRRKKWINYWYDSFCCSRATSKQVGNMTIVSYFGHIETATCRDGDNYDRKVGEAICYAKLHHQRIPEYI